MPYIDVQTGVKHGNLADSQVEKSGHPPAILGVRMPGWPLILYTVRVYGSGSGRRCQLWDKQIGIQCTFQIFHFQQFPYFFIVILVSF